MNRNILILAAIIIVTLGLGQVAPARSTTDDKLLQKVKALEDRVEQLEEHAQYQYGRWDEVRESQIAITQLLEDRIYQN